MNMQGEGKRTTVIKAALCMGGAMMILALNYLLFRLYVGEYLSLQPACIAARDIPPRTRISEEDVMDHTYTEKADIIGKYTEIQGMIPAGSPFYRTMLFREEDLPDRAAVQLRQGQTSFTMNTDVSALGSITAGMRADLYVTVERRGETPLSGCLFRNVRVLAVRDHKGTDLRDADSTGIPYLIETAVSSEDIPLLTLAETAGDIRLFPTAESYQTDTEAQLVQDSEIAVYLKILAAGG